MKIVSVYDAAIDAYMQPLFVQTVGQAIRMFTDEANREGSAIGQHPDDYTLYLVGEFDEATGLVRAMAAVPISRAKEVIRTVG